MRGTKRQKRPGIWELRIYIGRDANDRPIQRSVTFRGGARDADRELARLITQLEDEETAAELTVEYTLQSRSAIMDVVRDKGRVPYPSIGRGSNGRCVPTGSMQMDR
jgi:hypothetical protein